LNESQNIEYERRLSALDALGYKLYRSARDLARLTTDGGIVGRVLHVGPGRIRFAYPALANAAEYPVSADLNPVLAELRSGDVVVIAVREGVVGEIMPAVIVRQTLEPSDPEPGVARVLQREQELFWSETARKTFRDADRVVAFLRSYLSDRGFLEVAMPVLTSNSDISPNPPFRTRASDGTVLNLRTTYPYSERLLYSLTKIYQIGPNFRDEPSGIERSPEFNMLSIGQSMADYEVMMDLGESLVRDLTLHIKGSTNIDFFGQHVDLRASWTRLSTAEAVTRYAGVDIDDCFDLSKLEQILLSKGLALPETPFAAGRSQIYHGAVFDVLLKKFVYPRLRQPTFLTEFPYFFGGPGRAVDPQGRFKMRAEGFVAGIEIAETASVLTDPRHIRRWHTDIREEKRRIGWMQAEDVLYLDTVDRGLLVPSVIAFGIERLLMLVLGKTNISEVMWYSYRM
jgi:lysyl-tRNA synthetase, class II